MSERGPLPSDPLACRQRAEALLTTTDAMNPVLEAFAWALLAIAGELHATRAELRRTTRK